MKTDGKYAKLKDFLFHWLPSDVVEMTEYCLEKLRRSTSQKMPKRKREVCRTYRSGDEKKINAAKASEIKRASGAINKFIVKKNSTEIEESD